MGSVVVEKLAAGDVCGRGEHATHPGKASCWTPATLKCFVLEVMRWLIGNVKACFEGENIQQRITIELKYCHQLQKRSTY